MKKLILYDNTGKISLIQDIANNETYSILIEDIPNNKQPIKVDINSKKCILENTKDEDLEKENEILTDKIIELTAQNLISKTEEEE